MARFTLLPLVLGVAAAETQRCWEHSMWSECASACPRSCNDAGDVPCIAVCVADCVCDEGYVRSGRSCVKPEDCSATGCQSCASTQCVSGAMCIEEEVECVRAPCCPSVQCVDCRTEEVWSPRKREICCGRIAADAPRPEQCDQQSLAPTVPTVRGQCWEHSMWSECASACPRSCNDAGDVPCIKMCVADCVC
eukprot:Hpha_TRINITY_DN15934_c1_g5::TRINITY_DN15934_c1_g5_i2::g.73683::m.73683